MFDNDPQMNTASKGVVVVTPDGTKRFRIRVDNSGNIVTEPVSTNNAISLCDGTTLGVKQHKTRPIHERTALLSSL